MINNLSREGKGSVTRNDLTRSEAKLKAILETAVEGIITIDRRGIIESINPAAQKMFGYRADELVGQNIGRLMPSPYSEEHDGYLASYIETGVGKIIGIGREVIGLRRDGTVFPMYLSVGEAWLDDQWYFTGIIQDLSERKRIEQQLVQSERLAAIGQMLAVVSHESRNALQRISAGVEMLEMEVEGPAATQDVERIRSACEGLASMFDAIRDYAAPLQLDRSVCSMATVWRLAWRSLEHLWYPRGAVLCEELDGCDLECWLDEFRLQQVFRNLFENSLAACSDPARIRLSCHAATASNGELSIRYRDNGPGLNAEQQERVFEAFYTTKTTGSGLGMAIARRIVEAHGGQITTGNGDNGAEFVINLPRQRSKKPKA